VLAVFADGVNQVTYLGHDRLVVGTVFGRGIPSYPTREVNRKLDVPALAILGGRCETLVDAKVFLFIFVLNDLHASVQHILACWVVLGAIL